MLIPLCTYRLRLLNESVLVCAAGMGYLGAALATAISFWLQFLTLLVYILFLKVHKYSLCTAWQKAEGV